MIYNTITLSITNKCNADCPICCFACDPQNSEVLEDSVLENTINSLKEDKNIQCIAISGGEPFLYPEKVFYIANLTYSAKKSLAIYTNGFWCNDYDKTYETLLNLKLLGLTLILTSVDIFHQHYIDIENIKILLKVCRSLGISAKIHSSITCSGLSETDELLRKLGQDKLGVTVSQSAVLPIGKAKDLCESEIIKTVNIKSMYCPFHNMCEINWKGDVFACCSQSQNSAFCLGNIYKENITYILKNIRKNKYFFMLNKYGFEWIVDKVKKENIISINDMYSDSCDLCNELFSDRRVCNFLASMTV